MFTLDDNGLPEGLFKASDVEQAQAARHPEEVISRICENAYMKPFHNEWYWHDDPQCFVVYHYGDDIEVPLAGVFTRWEEALHRAGELIDDDKWGTKEQYLRMLCVQRWRHALKEADELIEDGNEGEPVDENSLLKKEQYLSLLAAQREQGQKNQSREQIMGTPFAAEIELNYGPDEGCVTIGIAWYPLVP